MDRFFYLSLVTNAPSGGARAMSFANIVNLSDFAGTGTSPAFVLVDANNVSFGTSGSQVTATVAMQHVAPARSVAWAELGVWVGTGSPSGPVQYSQWSAGSPGYWAWVSLP